MARPKRDLVPEGPDRDWAWELRVLRHLKSACEPDTPTAALARRLIAANDEVIARGLPPQAAAEAMWAVVDGLGLRQTAERRLEGLSRQRAQREANRKAPVRR